MGAVAGTLNRDDAASCPLSGRPIALPVGIALYSDPGRRSLPGELPDRSYSCHGNLPYGAKAIARFGDPLLALRCRDCDRRLDRAVMIAVRPIR